jgi:ribonucleoside-diphosphate reductase alpha chain
VNRITENALTVLQSRYLLRDNHGMLAETVEQLFHRVAKHIAGAEKIFGSPANVHKYEQQFFKLLNGLLFIPNSPTLMNAGTEMNQLSACFVLPVHDSIESIFDTLKHTALIQKSGGGTGFNFSEIRPKNEFVASTGGDASGPLSFMKIYDAATENIRQGGKRRGANMGILNVSHPDIEEFITSKNEEGILRNFNISVAATDEFMQAVESDSDWTLSHPSREHRKTVKARSLWDLIIYNAWKSGDPGMIFIDTINASNPTPTVGNIECTNPCGEVPLLPFEPCNLGSINLSKMVSDGQVNWKLMEDTVRTAIRFLDNVIEVNNYVLPEIERMAKGNRKIGLGVMGWADLLIQLEIPYASDKAVELAEELMKFINDKSADVSEQLAEERGVFRNWKKSTYHHVRPMRNATRTSIAPTGTISIIANASSSIEPLFALAFTRQNVLKSQELPEINELFISHLQKHGLYNEEVIAEVLRDGITKNTKLPEQTKKLFATSHEIDFEWHIRHQVAFQKHTDNAVSKTINFPEEATEQQIADTYFTAWKQGAKGITVYREGSKSIQVLNRGVDRDLPRNNTCQICAG